MHAGWLLPRVGTIACQSQFGSSNTSKRVPPKWSSWVIPVIGDDGLLSGTTVVQTSTRRNHGISSPICHPTLTCSSQAGCLKFQAPLAENCRFKAAQFCYRRMSDRAQGRGSECLGIGPSFHRCYGGRVLKCKQNQRSCPSSIPTSLQDTLPPRRYTLVSFVAILISTVLITSLFLLLYLF